MRAMLLERQGSPLRLTDLPMPQPNCHQLMLRVNACAICRTDLHVVDGELALPKHTLIPGHQIIGTVERLGKHATHFAVGDRVGVPWLGWTCGDCHYCRTNRENLCDEAKFIGYQLDGGFAEYMVADERFCFPIPQGYSDLQAAPLLCAGLIGYRALQMTGDAERIGFYGFGSAAHIFKWHGTRGGKYMPLPGRETSTLSNLLASWARFGPEMRDNSARKIWRRR